MRRLSVAIENLLAAASARGVAMSEHEIMTVICGNEIQRMSVRELRCARSFVRGVVRGDADRRFASLIEVIKHDHC